MTTFTATFTAETVTRTSDVPYTHAARRVNGTVTFHRTFAAAAESAGRFGEVVRVADDAPVAIVDDTTVWEVIDVDDNVVGRYAVKYPPEAVAEARADGYRVKSARRVR